MPYICQVNNLHCHPRKHRGAALMVMLVILVMGSAAFLVSSLGRVGQQIERDQKTAEALAQAKEALIAYAVTYADNHAGSVPGYLPCPDQGQNITQDGNANSTCGTQNVSAIGKLPWKTLGLSPLKDSDGECLWYVVSGTYKDSPKTQMMNDDTDGLFEVMASDGVNYLAGSSTYHPVVAIIFAPGTATETQGHTSTTGTPSCGGNYTASNYLDNDTIHSINNSAVSATASAISRFIAGPVKDNTSGNVIVNDRMIFITKDDIFNAIMRRADFVNPTTNPLLLMTQKAAECIADYGRNRNSGGLDPTDKRLPWSGRAWTSATDYLIDSNYRDSSFTKPLSGRLPYRVSGSRSATTGTNNVILSPYYQLQSDGANCPSVAGWQTTYYTWWTNWKDHVFYALAYSYRPATPANPPPTACGTCLTVNGAGPYIAVVIFSGPKLSGQVRAASAPGTTSNDRLNFANYLEGRNFTNHPNTLGNSDYQSGPATSSFNDKLFCIQPDLSVVSCP